jgi:hypothetical protein
MGQPLHVLQADSSAPAYPVWSMIDDAGGPALDELAVPAGGTVGVPVDFSATPLDAWSAIVATHWSFGDGTTATDESVSHAYAAPGTYTVGTSSGDILGNTTSRNSTIVIAPAGGTGTGSSTSPTGPTPRLTLRITEAHRRRRDATRPTPPGRVPVGTRFAVTVDQTARVTLRSGRRSAGGAHTVVASRSTPATERTRAAPAGSDAAGSLCGSPPQAGGALKHGSGRRSPPAARSLHGHGSRDRVRRLGDAPAAFHDRRLIRRPN